MERRGENMEAKENFQKKKKREKRKEGIENAINQD